MRYFIVKGDSVHYCGFDSEIVLKAESEEELKKSLEYDDFRESMQDYVNGWTDEDSVEEHGGDFDEAALIFLDIEETTEAIYEEQKDWTCF